MQLDRSRCTATRAQRKEFADILTGMLGSARGHEMLERMAGKDFGFDTIALQSNGRRMLACQYLHVTALG